jgi:hypothetical protein
VNVYELCCLSFHVLDGFADVGNLELGWQLDCAVKALPVAAHVLLLTGRIMSRLKWQCKNAHGGQSSAASPGRRELPFETELRQLRNSLFCDFEECRINLYAQTVIPNRKRCCDVGPKLGPSLP